MLPEAYLEQAGDLIWEMCWAWSVQLPRTSKMIPTLYLKLLKSYFPMFSYDVVA